MAIANTPQLSMRVERAAYSRLAWAFAISLTLHLVVYGGYYAGKRFGWWQNWHWPAWMQTPKMLSELLKKKESPPPPQLSPELPLIFVDVNPATATPEPPKDTPYYSSKNSKAANLEPDQDTNTPKIDGKQQDMVKTEDVPHAKVFPLQPALPAETAKETQEELKPKPAYTPGDLALAKPDLSPAKPEPIPPKDVGEAPKARPRTIAEAMARQNNSRLPGEKMKQDGGVKRRARASLDVQATDFGAYDAELIAAVQNRWDDLLERRRWSGEQTGKVTLRFRLNADGTVNEVSIVEQTVDLSLTLLCQSAIRDPAPYRPWPSDMRRKIGDTFREVTFTFFYN